jgi:hypothetical protein
MIPFDGGSQGVGTPRTWIGGVDGQAIPSDGPTARGGAGVAAWVYCDLRSVPRVFYKKRD